MRTKLYFLACTLVFQLGYAEEEGSILYPKQIQPKLTFRQRCEIDNEWKRFGTLQDCVDEKRHEQIVANQKKILRQQIELTEEMKALMSGKQKGAAQINGMRQFLEGGQRVLNPQGQ